MRAGLAGIAVASTVALMGALPSGAVAAEGCLYQQGGTRDVAKLERSIFCLTNLHRFRNGVPLLRIDTRLSKAARGHSGDMVARGYFSHFSPDGGSPSDRAAAAGYPGGAAENIAAAGGRGSPGLLFELWRGSAGHNTNMLDAGYRSAGFGVATSSPGGGGGITGTQMFGFADANTGDTAMSFYVSSAKCGKAKLALLKVKSSKGKKKRAKKKKAKKRAQRRVAASCKPFSSAG